MEGAREEAYYAMLRSPPPPLHGQSSQWLATVALLHERHAVGRHQPRGGGGGCPAATCTGMFWCKTATMRRVLCSGRCAGAGQRSAAGCLQRDRPAVGQPALQMGGETPAALHLGYHESGSFSLPHLSSNPDGRKGRLCIGGGGEDERVPLVPSAIRAVLAHRRTRRRGTSGGRSAWAACCRCTTRRGSTTSAASLATGRSRPTPRRPWAARGLRVPAAPCSTPLPRCRPSSVNGAARNPPTAMHLQRGPFIGRKAVGAALGGGFAEHCLQNVHGCNSRSCMSPCST